MYVGLQRTVICLTALTRSTSTYLLTYLFILYFVDFNLHKDGELLPHLSSSAIAEDAMTVSTKDGQTLKSTAGSNIVNRSTANSSKSSQNDPRFFNADFPVTTSLSYCWVVQHHSALSYADFWSHPVKLLTEFCQTEDYKSLLVAGRSAEVSSRNCGSSERRFIRTKLPTSLNPKCLSPHLHHWNPSISVNFADYFHDRIKVVSVGNVVYRCWMFS